MIKIRHIWKYKETLSVTLMGFIIFAILNAMMLCYHYDLWTNPKVGFWTAFWNRFEISGFDTFTYIVISKWRPLFILSRHPLLSLMMWPLSELNVLLKDITGINCAIHIVAVIWTILSTISWTLMYNIQRRLLNLNISSSLLLTVFFFSFSHVLLTTFVEDHMSITLPLLLLSIYWSGKAIKERRKMPLQQSLPLLFLSTGVTTTNCVKIVIADLATRWRKDSFHKIIKHFLVYLIPLAIIVGMVILQNNTTQIDEEKSIENTVQHRAQHDSAFADKWKKQQIESKKTKSKQLINLDFVSYTEHTIDRMPSLVENVFGEGLILHERYSLTDANKRHRPVLVRYENWWMYAIEASVILLFIAGVWCGRRERLMWMVMLMFLFDMLLHVGLNFASADIYIMTAHWAFVIPISIAYLLKHMSAMPLISNAIISVLLFLTLFMLTHNMQIITRHIFS